MTTTAMEMKMMMMMMMLLSLMKPADARINVTAGRAHMRAEWFNPKYARLSLQPDERFFFQQVGDVIRYNIRLLKG